MSTSDAGEFRVGGGESATPLYRTAPATTDRALKDKTFETFQQENHYGDETPTGQDGLLSAIRQEGTHKALIFRTDRLRQEEEGANCGDSEVQVQKPAGPRVTSCLFLTLSKNQNLNKPERKLKKKLEICPHSLADLQWAETGDRSSQVNKQASPRDHPLEAASRKSEPVPLPTKKEEDVTTVVCSELETTRDLSTNYGFSNDYESHECNGLPRIPCGSQQKRNSSGSVALEKYIKNFINNKAVKELSSPSVTMLSSSVVTVLAPHWGTRPRRTKRFEGSSTSEAQGNLQDVTNTAANCAQEGFQDIPNQHCMERVLTDRSQAQQRTPFLYTRSNTVGWSSKSDSASLDYESKRKMVQAISLDVNSGRMDNKKKDTGALTPVNTAASPLCPLSLNNPNEKRRTPQTGHQRGVLASSSKPTTSSMLLSLRRFNSNGRSSNAASNFTTNEQDQLKPLLSQSPVSYRTTENHFFSPSPINKDSEDTLVTHQTQTIGRTQGSLTCSKHAFLNRGPSEKQHINTNIFSESSVSLTRKSSYDHSALVKTPSLPRTTMTSHSWWKQVTQEDTLPPNDTNNIKDKPNTPIVPPCNDHSDLASPSLTENKRFRSQIFNNNNRDNNTNITESVCKGNVNLVIKAQGGTHNVTQRNSEDSPAHESDRLVKQQNGSNLNNREPQKPHSLPSALSSSKISTTTVQTTLSHPKDLNKHDISNSSFTENVTEPPTLLNPKSSNTPTESSSKLNNKHGSSRSNSIPISPHNSSSERFTKQPFSPATSKTISGLPLSPNTKAISSFHSHSVSSQTNMNTSSHTCSSSQTPKYTKTANATPLGFQRSYASIPKSFHPKTVSSLIPTVSAFSNTNCNSVSTASIPAFTACSHLVSTTLPSPTLLTSPITPVITSPTTISSILTPPTTPVITSHSYSETSSPNEAKTFSSSPKTNQKKQLVGGKKVRRVTWEDSVDLQQTEANTEVKPDPSQVPLNPLSPTKTPQSVRAPFIFSFLRSNSPNKNTSPLCSPSPKTSSIQVGRGGKFRSLSSDSADLKSRQQEKSKQRLSDIMILDQERQHFTTMQERTQAAESGTAQCHSAAPLSLPPDFSSGYKLRYSSPPYSSLMSSRSGKGETNTILPRSPLFQQASQSVYTPHLALHTDPAAVIASKPPMLPIIPPQPVSLPLQNKTAMQASSKCGVSETDRVSNNHCKNSSQDDQNRKILLVDNRVHISSESLHGDEAYNSSSTCVTETLVYSIKSKAGTATAAPENTTPKLLQLSANMPVSVETRLSQQLHTVHRKQEASKPHSPSNQSSSGSSSTEGQSWDEEGCKSKVKVLGKSRFFSVESTTEQSPKRSRFALKKSVSTPNPNLSRSDSERSNKTNNKMDQVLNRLRQTFSNRRSDDDQSFPWKWKRASQTPSVSGSSDVSSVSDVTVDSTKTLEEREQHRDMLLKDKETEGTSRWAQNKYTITPPSTVGRTMAGNQFSGWSDELPKTTDQDEQNTEQKTEHKSDSKTQIHLTVHSPTVHQFDFYKDKRTDYKPTNQFLFCRDISPESSPDPSSGYHNQFRKSASSPRSPFSPFSSLSPVSPFSSPDVTDDSVFYSPKLARRRESSSPCEPGEGFSLGASRRSRASTGPPSAGPVQDKVDMASSYADLKYGIEPGRSFSVSSVLSSRPSGPGRISTGSRFMSVGDLSASALTCGGTVKDLDRWSFTPDWTTEHDFRPTGECNESYFPSDPGKMRSRSLPRSLTRRLANWSSGVSISQSVINTTSKPACLRSPNMNTCHFAWNTEGPPTPPPTPPLSPLSRRMSSPSSVSSPTFSSSPGVLQHTDSQSSRGHLPSRGYISSLSTFEESSDSSSDTTTDDEYYLETGEDEKETEL